MGFPQSFFTFIIIIFSTITYQSHKVQSSPSQAETLLAIQRLLNYPPALSNWNNSTTDFCYTAPVLSLMVICENDAIIALHIIGNSNRDNPSSYLPLINFSMESLVTTLAALPALKRLTLSSLGLTGSLPAKISHLSSLEGLNLNSNFLRDPLPEELLSLPNLASISLDDNLFAGELPNWIGSLPALTSLSIKKNMFNGTLPDSITNLTNLESVTLAQNYFQGNLPDLSRLKGLQVVDLEGNEFETECPCYLLGWNSMTVFDIGGNKFSGKLSESQSCGVGLEFVDLSSNFLTGNLPKCLAVKNSSRTVLFDGNCLKGTGDRASLQRPLSYCDGQSSAGSRHISDLLITITTMIVLLVAGWIE
ncbi:unnamed protein product [Linum tenue]|uniref:Leucine-rich repeat-containing N-terminal plant-type domain-containing protein n=1 Tax=Linum tenue TaxID=586396 RepID=A0AAV0HIZ2_9ROSI|nr:unnamed protein product [Linum tenue]